MRNVILTEESYGVIVSMLIDAQIKAEKYNKHGINDAFIESCSKALEELKEK